MSCYSLSMFVLCCLAIVLSGYSIYVEKQANLNADYEALCDISPQMSCTRVFASKYGKGFGISWLPERFKLPNGVYGAGFFSLIALLSLTKQSRHVKTQFSLSVLSTVLLIRFGYVLYFVLEDVCVVTISIYILNIINTILSAKKLDQLEELKKTKIL